MTDKIYKARMPISIKTEEKKELAPAEFMRCDVFNNTPHNIYVSEKKLFSGYWDREPKSGIAARSEDFFAAQSTDIPSIAGSVTYTSNFLDFTIVWWFIPNTKDEVTIENVRDPDSKYLVTWGINEVNRTLFSVHIALIGEL